jgi:hypothetical protein
MKKKRFVVLIQIIRSKTKKPFPFPFFPFTHNAHNNPAKVSKTPLWINQKK